MIDRLATLKARMQWYRDGCPWIADVGEYKTSGDCARDAAADLEKAIAEIERVRSAYQWALLEDLGHQRADVVIVLAEAKVQEIV